VEPEENAVARSRPVNMLLCHQTSGPLLGNAVFSIQSMLRLYSKDHQDESVSCGSGVKAMG
jgi:hypothetical protein